jgi:hypothetical protein
MNILRIHKINSRSQSIQSYCITFPEYTASPGIRAPYSGYHCPKGRTLKVSTEEQGGGENILTYEGGSSRGAKNMYK